MTSPFATIPNFETVTFFDRGTRMGTAATANGTAKFSTRTLRPGTRNIDATYNGDATFKRSSGTLTQVVELAWAGSDIHGESYLCWAERNHG